MWWVTDWMLSPRQLTNPEVNTLSLNSISDSEEPVEYHTERLHVVKGTQRIKQRNKDYKLT